MLYQYQVEVTRQGRVVATHDTTALNGLDACNAVEARYGKKPVVSTGPQGKLIVARWHGYEFAARRIAAIKVAGGDIITTQEDAQCYRN